MTHFRIFIDAATLKQFGSESDDGIESYFRIFIDAATLKHGDVQHANARGRADFRIFIDAATLKHAFFGKRCLASARFPHLYRCGHIEAHEWRHIGGASMRDFRIFIDAATLKLSNAGAATDTAVEHFRIFIDAATLKLKISIKSPAEMKKISASL